MTSETDEQFLRRIADYGQILGFDVYDIKRLRDLARRGAEAADTITALRAEVERQVQWVKDLANNLIAEEAKTATLRAEIERLRAGNRDLQLWFDDLKIEYDKLRAALEPLACTCPAKHQEECSRSEVDCPFWNARQALAQEKPPLTSAEILARPRVPGVVDRSGGGRSA